jgi:hypothetical protein
LKAGDLRSFYLCADFPVQPRSPPSPFPSVNRISYRRASVLAYLSNLLLPTLPAIAAEEKAGIVWRPFSSEPDPGQKRS